jgi:hypothetical protein
MKTYSKGFVRSLLLIIALEAAIILVNFVVLGIAAEHLHWCITQRCTQYLKQP